MERRLHGARARRIVRRRIRSVCTTCSATSGSGAATGMASYDVQPRPGDGLRSPSASRYRVFRGGSFSDDASLARSAIRGTSSPGVPQRQPRRPSRQVVSSRLSDFTALPSALPGRPERSFAERRIAEGRIPQARTRFAVGRRDSTLDLLNPIQERRKPWQRPFPPGNTPSFDPVRRCRVSRTSRIVPILPESSR